MHCSDEAARATAYHAQAQAAAWGIVALYFQTHGFILYSYQLELRLRTEI
jgi:hypothetical protein